MIRTLTATLLACMLASPAFADGGLTTGRDNDRSSADVSSLLAPDARPLSLKVYFQARYLFNSADTNQVGASNPDDDTTVGFVIRRTEVDLKRRFTDDLTGKFRFGFDRSGGAPYLLDGYLDWDFAEGVTIRVGQFKPPLLREELMSASYQLAPERSSTNATFTQDRSQGVMLTVARDRWRASLALTDGINADNTSFDSAVESDFAVTARAEVLLGDAGFDRFGRFGSFPGGSPGAMLGLAGHTQSGHDTNPAASPGTDVSEATIDLSLVGDGWSAFGAFVWRRTDTGPTAYDDFGAVAQGGLFVSEHAELFARWEAVFPDSARGATGSDFNALLFGVNWYLIPASDAARVTLAVGWTLDPTTASIVRVSDGINLLADSGSGQIGVTAQLQLIY